MRVIELKTTPHPRPLPRGGGGEKRVFFRAKEWEDALKVLKGMTDVNIMPFALHMKQIVADNVWQLNSSFLNLIIHSEGAETISFRFADIFILFLLFFAFVNFAINIFKII